MMRRIACLALFAIFLQVVAASIITQAPLPVLNGPDQNDRATVYDFEPKWSPLGLTNGATNYITVNGCGFKAHAEAVCLFDFEFTSTYSRIVDDNTIICELPELEISQFYTLPQYSRLDVLFDGDLVTDAVYAGQFRWGPELKNQALSATRGPTSGGPSISIFGEGFQDPVLTALGGFKVFFDGVEASASVTSDTVITATPPPVSELGIEALVSVLFFGDLEDRGPVEVYLHARQYFYYGPLFTGITPACAFLNVSRTMTINGVGFDDPLFVGTVTSPEGGSSFGTSRVLLEIEVAGFTPPVWTDSSLQDTPDTPSVLQTYGTVSSGTSITFSSPNWFAGVSAPTPTQIGTLLNKRASVTILWRQTRRLTSTSGVLGYTHGPQAGGLDNEHWYYGGDNICLLGCGFTDPSFSASANNDLVQLFISGSPLWDLTSTSTLSDSSLCYDINPDVDCGSVTVNVQITQSTFLAGTSWNSGILVGNYFAGPAINANQQYYTTVSDGTVTISGNHLGYSLASRTNVNTWGNRGVFLTTTSQSTKSSNFLGTAVNLLTTAPNGYQIALASSSDTSITLSFNGVATFGEVFTLSFRFDSTCTVNPVSLSFGPTCASTLQSGPLTGSSPVTVTGNGLSNYATAIKLCDTFADANKNYETPSPLGFWGDMNPCHIQQTTGEPVGTVEFYNAAANYVASPSITTSGLFSLPDAFRGKRNWGQIFDIVLMVNSAQDDTFVDVFSGTTLTRTSYAVNWTQCVDYDGTRHTGTNRQTGCISATSIACGQYRFGPITDSFSPCQGPIGPEDAFITPVTFSGSDFDDAWAGVSRSINPHLVTFGTLFGSPIVSSISADSMSTNTVWGGNAIGDAGYYGQDRTTSVAVFFDTCNITVVPDLTVYWGPQFLPCPLRVDTPTTGLETYNSSDSCDIYGFLPTGFYPTQEDTVYIEGYNFFESDNTFGPVRCIIDGVESRVTQLNNIHGSNRYTIQCEVPPRPFNTRAKVCVAFSTFYANSDQEYGNPRSLFAFSNQDAYSSERVLCVEDQVLVFSPLLLPVTGETYAGHTSGTSDGSTAEQFDVFCVGCENYWLSGNVNHWEPTYWVGGYETTASFDNVNTITFDVPTFVAEFNTDVSIAISWEALHNQSYYESPNTYNTTDGHEDFLKVWAPFTYHYGPSCAGPTTNNVFLYGTDNGGSPDTTGTLRTLVMSVSFFQDCYDFDSLCTDTSSNGKCVQPQYTSGLQHPFTTNGIGSRTCLHRNVTLRMDNVLDASDFYTDIQRTDDTLDVNNGDSTFEFILPDRGNNIDCDTYEFTFDFYDALVTNPDQRTISCDGTLTYGPGAPTITGFYTYTINSVATIYGWGQNRQTTVGTTNDDSFVSVSYNTDPYLNASWHLDLRFGSSTVAGSTTHSGGPDDYDVPNGAWKSLVQISSIWSSGSRSICNYNGPKFHYGPEILSGSRDNCLNTLLCTGATGQSLTISGRALFCCGYNNAGVSDGALYQHRCGWSALSGRSFYTTSTFVPSGKSSCSGPCSVVESVTCTIPDNNQPNAAAKRLVGFGLFFGASTTANPGDGSAATWCNGGTCDISNANTNLVPYAQFDNDATLSENNVMQVCWGPKLAPAEFHTRYSGYAPRSFGSLVNPDDVDTFPLDIFGDTCGEINPVNINSTFPAAYHTCAYSGADGSETTISETLGECPSRLFAKQCDATDDTLVVTFLSLTSEDVSGTYQYTPHEFVTTGNERGDFFAEGSTAIENTVSYGPLVSGWSASSNNANIWAPVLTKGDTQVHFPLHPTNDNVEITVTLTYADDWIAPLSTNTPVASSPSTMWGTELGVCLFGVLDTANPAYLLASSQYDSSYVPTFYTLDWTGTNTIDITCDVPNGQFNQRGNVYVLLDPHSDSYTQHYLSSDPSGVSDRAGYWYWTPYVASLSSSWSALEGDEPVTFYGYGFSGYTNVVCDFGGFEALQGDIVSDNLIICQSPSSAVPQTSSVTFTFTDAASGNCQLDAFSDCGLPITASLTNAYTFTGVTNYSPRAGPIQGNTTIFFQQVGFANYDSVDCVIEHPSGAETIAATPATADLNGDWQCVTTAVSAPETSQISLIGHYQNFLGSTVYSVNLGCVYFDYELPRITSISPSSLTFGNTASVSIRISGDYFNGGSNTAEYSCNWQHGTNPESDLPAELGVPPTFPSGNTYTTPATLVATTTTRDGLSVATYDVVCSTPASGFAQIGSYPFELIFSGSATANSLTYDITEQALSTSAISPDTIADFDLNRTLTITGTGFNGGRKLSADRSSSYLCRTVASDGSVIIGAANYISDTEVECVAAPANVTQGFLDYKAANRKNCTRYVDPGTTNPTPSNRNKVCYSPTFEFEVSVSIDGGYTWSNAQTLNVFHRELCKTSGASSLLVSFVLIPLFALFFFFMI